jgi:hypothetical protein
VPVFQQHNLPAAAAAARASAASAAAASAAMASGHYSKCCKTAVDNKGAAQAGSVPDATVHARCSGRASLSAH